MTSSILIVDDNPVNLKLACDVLEASGFQIRRAADAEQAILILQREIPNLILMDIALPGIDGLSLTRLIKGDARLRHIPVVALTAFAMKGDDQKAFDAGCSGYITKPIDTRRIAEQVETFLRRAESEDK